MIWLLRALLAAAVFAAFALAPPALGFDAQVWFGDCILAQGGVPLALGNETFGAPGSPSGAFGWLSAVVLALLERGGARTVAAAGALCICAALALVEARARRRAPEYLAFAAAALAGLTLLDSLRPGGGAAGWLAAAAFAFVVERTGRRSALASVALAVLWCNLSVTGAFAPALAVLVALGRTLGRDDPAATLRAWLVAAGCALALLATPAGWEYVALAPAALHLDASFVAPANALPDAYRFGFAATIVVATYFGLRGAPPGDVLLALGSIVAVLVAGAALPLLGIVAAPILAGASAGESRPGERRPLEGPATGRAIALAGALAFAVAATYVARGPEAHPFPRQLVAQLAADGREHRLLCGVRAWCGDALGDGGNVRVYMDDRTQAYPAAVREREFRMTRGRDAWRADVAAARVDSILLERHATLAGLLELEPGWRRAGSDAGALLYTRVSP